MNRNLLIVGAGVYALVAKEIAESMGCFEKIAFVDDHAKITPNGIDVIGTVADMENLICDYANVIVAIGNPQVRLELIKKFQEEIPCRIVTLVSPRAYVSPTAQIEAGSIIEPMAVVHTGCVISVGCIISAGAVINHASLCCEGVHVDCNATVEGYSLVPAGTKVCAGDVFSRKGTVKAEDLFATIREQSALVSDISKRTPVEIEGLEYTFESGM